MAGAAECWNSPDGEFWTKRGIPAPNEPHTNRMNVAAGLAKNGDLLVLCSGWTDVKQPQRPKQAVFRDDILAHLGLPQQRWRQDLDARQGVPRARRRLDELHSLRRHQAGRGRRVACLVLRRRMG